MRLMAVAGVLVVGLAGCGSKSSDKPSPAPAQNKAADAAVAAPKKITMKGVDLAKVPAAGADDPPSEAVMVTVSKSEILVEGDPIVQLTDGAAPPAERTMGKYGVEISKLRIVLEKHALRIRKLQSAQGLEVKLGHFDVTIVADASTAYDLLVSVLYSASQAEFGTFKMVVMRDNDKLGTIATSLLRPADVEPVAAGGLNLVVNILPTELTLFSTSDTAEGTAVAPKLKLAATSPGKYELAPLNAAAAEIVKRRFPAAERPDGSTQITLLADKSIPYQTIIDVIVALRASPEGVPLFPNVIFATGVQ